MKVTLAYPYEDADGKMHDPDSTVELEDPVAKGLLHDGLARPAESRVSTAKKKED